MEGIYSADYEAAEMTGAHRREIFSKSCQIKPKSDCIYHAPIDLVQKTDTAFGVQINLKMKPKSDGIYHVPIDLEQQTDTVHFLFQINRCMVNTI